MPLYAPTLSNHLPDVYSGVPPINQYTEGDLHGNPIRLLEGLYHYGVIDVNKQDYAEIVNHYAQACDDPNNTTNNKELLALLRNKIKIKDTRLLVRLIGDMIADRGANDAFTLTLIEVLIDLGVPIRPLLSNHDIEAMKCLLGAKNIEEVKAHIAENSGFFARSNQAQSFLNLISSVERGELSFEDVQRMSHKYFSKMVLLDYSIDEWGRLEIYSHAPINLEILAELGEQFGVNYPGDDSSREEKMDFINQINLRFQSFVQLDNHQIIKDVFALEDSNKPETFTPAAKIIWTREQIVDEKGRVVYRHKFIDPRHNIINCYGHDKKLEDWELGGALVQRIDNENGKRGIISNGDNTSISSNHWFTNILRPVTESDKNDAMNIYKSGKLKLNPQKFSSPMVINEFKRSLQTESKLIKKQLIEARGKDNDDLTVEATRLELLINICMDAEMNPMNWRLGSEVKAYQDYFGIDAWTGLPKEPTIAPVTAASPKAPSMKDELSTEQLAEVKTCLQELGFKSIPLKRLLDKSILEFEESFDDNLREKNISLKQCNIVFEKYTNSQNPVISIMENQIQELNQKEAKELFRNMGFGPIAVNKLLKDSPSTYINVISMEFKKPDVAEHFYQSQQTNMSSANPIIQAIYTTVYQRDKNELEDFLKTIGCSRERMRRIMILFEQNNQSGFQTMLEQQLLYNENAITDELAHTYRASRNPFIQIIIPMLDEVLQQKKKLQQFNMKVHLETGRNTNKDSKPVSNNPIDPANSNTRSFLKK